jgi:hypothetical protein
VEEQDLEAAPWQCTCSHVTPHPWIFGKAWGNCHPNPSADLAPADILLFLRLKSTLKGSRFQMIEENSLWDLCVILQNLFQN